MIDFVVMKFQITKNKLQTTKRNIRLSIQTRNIEAFFCQHLTGLKDCRTNRITGSALN